MGNATSRQRLWLRIFDAVLYIDGLLWPRRSSPKWIDSLELFCIRRAAAHTSWTGGGDCGPGEPF